MLMPSEMARSLSVTRSSPRRRSCASYAMALNRADMGETPEVHSGEEGTPGKLGHARLVEKHVDACSVARGGDTEVDVAHHHLAMRIEKVNIAGGNSGAHLRFRFGTKRFEMTACRLGQRRWFGRGRKGFLVGSDGLLCLSAILPRWMCPNSIHALAAISELAGCAVISSRSCTAFGAFSAA